MHYNILAMYSWQVKAIEKSIKKANSKEGERGQVPSSYRFKKI
jgi:hypothetical protein